MYRFEVGDDVRIVNTGTRCRIVDILHGFRYTVYVSAEDSEDGNSYCEILEDSELSF